MTDGGDTTSTSLSSSNEQSGNSPSVYINAGASHTQTTSTVAAVPYPIHSVATSPEITSSNELMPPYSRPRSRSEPSILYQQVALELRGISDDLNRQHSRHEVQKQLIID